MEELDGYSKQLEEFSGYSDLNDVPKYLKKAQALNGINEHVFYMQAILVETLHNSILARLETAAEKIEQFNAEEEAYGWDVSQYPQRKQLEQTLQPYLKLYETTVDFNNKNK